MTQPVPNPLPRITVIIPARNEVEAIGKVIRGIPDYVSEIIVADTYHRRERKRGVNTATSLWKSSSLRADDFILEKPLHRFGTVSRHKD